MPDTDGPDRFLDADLRLLETNRRLLGTPQQTKLCVLNDCSCSWGGESTLAGPGRWVVGGAFADPRK